MCSSVLRCLDLLSPPTSHPDVAPSHIADYFCPVRLLLPKPKSQIHRSSTSPKSRAVFPATHTEGCFSCKGQHKCAQNDWRDALIEPWVFSPLLLVGKKVGFGLQLFQKFYMRGKHSPALNDLSRAVSASWQEPLLKHQRASLPLAAQHCCQWLSSFYKSSCSRVQKPNNNLKMYSNNNMVVLMVRRSQISIIGVLMLRLVA